MGFNSSRKRNNIFSRKILLKAVKSSTNKSFLITTKTLPNKIKVVKIKLSKRLRYKFPLLKKFRRFLRFYKSAYSRKIALLSDKKAIKNKRQKVINYMKKGLIKKIFKNMTW